MSSGKIAAILSKERSVKMVIRSYYLHSGISYTGKNFLLNQPLGVCYVWLNMVDIGSGKSFLPDSTKPLHYCIHETNGNLSSMMSYGLAWGHYFYRLYAWDINHWKCLKITHLKLQL